MRQLKRRWLKLTADPACAPLAAKLQELAKALHQRLLALVGEPGPTAPKCRGVRKGACAQRLLMFMPRPFGRGVLMGRSMR